MSEVNPAAQPDETSPETVAPEPVVPEPVDADAKSDLLAAALAKQDVAAVAYALRNDVIVVPQLVVNGVGEQVRVFGREDTDKRMLLLFSSAENYARMVPDDPDLRVMMCDAQWLREFLTVHQDVLEMVFFDIAGPHVMQAAPDDLMKALGDLS